MKQKQPMKKKSFNAQPKAPAVKVTKRQSDMVTW